MTARQGLLALGALALVSAQAVWAADAAPQTVTIGQNEVVVHLAAEPFLHAYCKPNLETLLVSRYAAQGLAYRRVGMRGALDEYLRDLDREVFVHKPTLLIYQPGAAEIRSQVRRRTYDFDKYAVAVEKLAQRVREKGVRLVLCSPIPVGPSESMQKLTPPNDGIVRWVEGVRGVAARNDAAFVDLFSKAVTWPMISGDKTFYDTAHHEKSWALFLEQVRFVPEGSSVVIQAKDGACQAERAAVEAMKTDGGGLSFTWRNVMGTGPAILRVQGLAEGAWELTVNDKAIGRKTAQEMAEGVDLTPCLSSAVGSPDFLKELDAGHAASGAAAEALNYQLPVWLKVPDFEQQKRAEVDRLLKGLADHDARVREMVTPKPMAVRINPAK